MTATAATPRLRHVGLTFYVLDSNDQIRLWRSDTGWRLNGADRDAAAWISEQGLRTAQFATRAQAARAVAAGLAASPYRPGQLTVDQVLRRTGPGRYATRPGLPAWTITRPLERDKQNMWRARHAGEAPESYRTRRLFDTLAETVSYLRREYGIGAAPEPAR